MPKSGQLAELSIPAAKRSGPFTAAQFQPDKHVVITAKMASAMPRLQVPVKTDSPSSGSLSAAGGGGAAADDDDDEAVTPRAEMQFQAPGTKAQNNDDDEDTDEAETPRADANDMKAATAAASKKETSQLDQFELLGVLGVGAFAECHLAQRRADNKLFALKKFKKVMDSLTAQERQEAIGEVRLLANLVHENILRYEDSFLEGGAMHILMEYASGGTLDRLIDSYKEKGKLLSEELVWDCMVQLCGALKYCHSRSIMHRDIKPQNVMLSTSDESKCRLLLGDFGIAKIMAHQGAQTKELAGTPYYYSPELCKVRSISPPFSLCMRVGSNRLSCCFWRCFRVWPTTTSLTCGLSEWCCLNSWPRSVHSKATTRFVCCTSYQRTSASPSRRRTALTSNKCTWRQPASSSSRASLVLFRFLTSQYIRASRSCKELLEVDPANRPSAHDLMNRECMKVQVKRWRQHLAKLEEVR